MKSFRNFKTKKFCLPTLPLAVSLLVIAIAVTFAWMHNQQPIIQPEWGFKYGDKYRLFAESRDIYVVFSIKQPDESYLPVDQSEDDGTLAPLIEMSEMLPSDAVLFRIDFYNRTNAVDTADIVFSGVYGDEYINPKNGEKGVKLADALIISFSEASGYSDLDGYAKPKTYYSYISEKITYTTDENGKLNGVFPFVEKLVIPPTLNNGAEDDGTGEIDITKHTPISLYGYLLFDEEATVEFENLEFYIKNLYIM